MNDELELFENTKLQELSKTEKDLLIDCESVIEKGIEAFKDTWYALLEIRENRLYRSTHKSFKDYCKDKWNISESYVNRQIQAGKIIEDIKDTPIGTGLNESQLRPLTNLESETRREVVKQVFQISEKPTAKIIQELVNKNVGLNEILKELKLNPDLVFKSEEELIEKAKSLIPAPALVVQEVIKHVEIIKDESLKAELEQSKDTISELQKRIVDQASNYSKVQNKLIDYENKISDFDKKIKEIETLKSKLSEYEDVKNAMLQINELEKKKSDLFKHSQKVKDILEVLDSSRKFFNQNVLALGTIQLDNGIKESLQTQVIELINIIDSWKFALSNNLLLEKSLIGG